MKVQFTRSTAPQCAGCPLATYIHPFPRRRYEPAEPGGFLCAITEEFIPVGQEPREGKCEYLTGWLAAPPHALDVALARGDTTAAAEWLRENVPAAVLRAAWPGPSAAYVEAWNEFAARADGRIEN